MVEGANVHGPGRCQHLRCLNNHVAQQRLLVISPLAVNLQHRNAPGIHALLINFDKVGGVRQTLSEAAESHLPGARLAQRVLETRAESAFANSPLPSFAFCRALIRVAPQEIFLLG